VGSTKSELMGSVRNHPKRTQYIGTHPMAGTEYSGPEAAIPNLFNKQTTVICDAEQSKKEAVELIEKMYNSMEMKLIYMDAKSHDVHTAYISHISHISSFALALTVLEKEKDEKTILDLASSGFSSTVRLAKSSANMWVPVFQQNRDNVLDVLDEHINSLSKFRTLLIKKDFNKIHDLIVQSNDIKRILGS
jgi:prephenate dehydrogenase